MGAPLGNQNARKGGWRDALIAAANEQVKGDPAKRRKLHAIADKLVELAQQGEIQAIKELGDRLDGKAPQAITGADGGPLEVVEVPWVRDRSR